MPAPVHRFLALLPVLLLLAAVGCDTLPGEESVEGNLYERLDRQSEFSAFTDALDAARLGALLHSGSPVTVLAPTTTAFEYLGADFLHALRQPVNLDAFTRVLRHHIIAGHLTPDDFVDGATLQTIDGATLTVQRVGPVVRIDGATLDLTAPVEAEGSVAYPVADVLLRALTIRERVMLSPSLSQFTAYARTVGLLDEADAMPSATVLAPINDAFTALGPLGSELFQTTTTAPIRQRVLAAHLAAGTPALVDNGSLVTSGGDPLAIRVEEGVWTVGGARVLREETLADGRLLVLGGVALEELSLAQRLRIEYTPRLYRQELVQQLPSLWERLSTDSEELTVFAPTDFAYNQRGAAVNSVLSDAPSAPLNRRLLQTYVVPGRYTPEDLTDGLELTTLEGFTLVVNRSGSLIMLNGRRLNPGAIQTSNGALYTIDIPIYPKTDALDTALLQGFAQHVLAVRRAGLEDTFRTPGITTFMAEDRAYLADPNRLITNPRPFLLWNATASSIPTLGPTTFIALDGSARSISSIDCPAGTPLEPADPSCSPFRLDGITQLYQGTGASDGTGFFHYLREPSYPPGY